MTDTSTGENTHRQVQIGLILAIFAVVLWFSCKSLFGYMDNWRLQRDNDRARPEIGEQVRIEYNDEIDLVTPDGLVAEQAKYDEMARLADGKTREEQMDIYSRYEGSYRPLPQCTVLKNGMWVIVKNDLSEATSIVVYQPPIQLPANLTANHCRAGTAKMVNNYQFTFDRYGTVFPSQR